MENHELTFATAKKNEADEIIEFLCENLLRDEPTSKKNSVWINKLVYALISFFLNKNVKKIYVKSSFS
jgi:hypothetical protein